MRPHAFAQSSPNHPRHRTPQTLFGHHRNRPELRHPAILGGVVMAWLSVMIPTSARAQIRYAVTDLGSFSPYGSHASAINASGTVVGWSNIDPFFTRAFRTSSNGLQSLGTGVTFPQYGDFSRAYAVSDSGIVVGISTADSAGIEPPRPGWVNLYGFTYATHMTRVDFPGCFPDGGVTGINNAGDYVGFNHCVENGSIVYHAWVRTSAGFADLSGACQFEGPASVQSVAINEPGQVAILANVGGGQSGFLWTAGTAVNIGLVPRGMNDAGDVVGWSGHAMLYHAGVTTDLGTLGHPAGSSDAWDINNLGQIVGTSDGYTRAFLYENGAMRDLNAMIDPASGFTLKVATGINDGGMICGDGSNAAGQPSAFVLTPCRLDLTTSPQPTSVCPRGTASFSVMAIGDGTVNARWQWQPEPGAAWADLANGINSYNGRAALDVAGATEATVRPHVLWGISSTIGFRCIVTNACGNVTSNPATLTICIADTDDGSGTGTCDGGVTIDDLLYYLFIFEVGELRADVDDGSSTGTPDGGVTIDDLLYFLFRFEAGC